MRNILKVLEIVVILLFVTPPLFAQELKLSNYLREGEKDATLAVLAMLQDASKQKKSKVIIEKGTYHFYPEKAYEQYSFITNHDNSLRRIAFPIINFDGLTIVGEDAKLVFHGVMMPFHIEKSKNIEISGLSVDWYLPLHSEALIEAQDTINNTFDLRISNHTPYTIRNDQLVFIKEGFEHDMAHAILFDPVRNAVAYRTADYTPLKIMKKVEIRNMEMFDFPNFIDFRYPEYESQDQEYSIKVKEIEPGLVRVYGAQKKMPPPGLVIVFKGRFGKDRIANAFNINGSSNINLHDLTIHYAGGMGILAERSSDILVDNVTIKANSENNLMVSTTADATHFSSCKGEIVIKNSRFQHQLDDALNVHGAYVLVEDVLAPDKIGVRIGHFQQAGFQFAEMGDELGFINASVSAEVEFKAFVKAFYKLNKDYYIITLNEKINHKIHKGYVIENLDWYPEVSIINNHFSDNRARGLLLKSPKKTIVKNNYFSNMMQAIIISGGINTWWYESGGAKDVLIENNTFGDCNYDGGKRPVISVVGKQNGKGRRLGKIIIRNNTFNNFNPSILKAHGVKAMEFTNNTINNSNTFEPTDPDAYVLDVKHIGQLRIDSVKISEDFKNKVREEGINKRSAN